MDLGLFEKCIKYISSKYKVVLLEDLLFSEALTTKNEIATIMFDDGYKDNIEFAVPILEKYECKASFYVVTDSIDHDTPTWTYILDYKFQTTNINDLILSFEFLPTYLHSQALMSQQARVQYAGELKPFLKKLRHSQRNQVLDVIYNTYKDVGIPKIMMNWEDLSSLRSKGHYVGSHTLSHCMLGTMEDEEEIFEELYMSGKRIQEKLGYFPMTISYPIGSYNPSTIKLAIKAGYTAGLAVKQKIYEPRINEPFEIPRIELYNESWLKTKFRITNTLENLKSLINFK